MLAAPDLVPRRTRIVDILLIGRVEQRAVAAAAVIAAGIERLANVFFPRNRPGGSSRVSRLFRAASLN